MPRGTIPLQLQVTENILVLDSAGLIVWANRAAHEGVGLPPGGLLGHSYLEYCPPETHPRLLDLHRRKLAGETVAFDMDLGDRRFRITSGPVRMGERLYLYVVARSDAQKPEGDESLTGMLAAGELLAEPAAPVDLNACLVGALKDEARSLKGRITLVPGALPRVRVRTWPLRVILRQLLLQSLPPRGRLGVETGGDARRAWLKLRAAGARKPAAPLLALSRRVLKEHGGRLILKEGLLTLSFPAA